MHYLGIDVSKKNSYVVHYDDEKKINEFILYYDSTSMLQFSSYLDYFDEKIIIYEATGVYSTIIRQFCKNNHLNYACLNPLETHLNIQSLRRHKTDQVDAHNLALMGPYLKKKDINNCLADEDQERKDCSRLIIDIEEQSNKLKNKLKARLFYIFPQLERIFKDNYGIPQLNLVYLFPHPDFILEHNKSSLKQLIKTYNSYTHSTLEKIVNQLIDMAQSTYITIKKNHPLIDDVRDICEDLIKFTKRKKKYRDKLIELCKHEKLFEVLLSIPGIGEQNAALLTGVLGNLNRFKTHKQLNAFVGIDIVRYQSGTINKKEHINRRGSNKARKILYQIIELIIINQRRYQNHICDYYYKLKKPPRNKSHRVAIVACINKLLKVTHYLYTHNLRYNYRLATTNN